MKQQQPQLSVNQLPPQSQQQGASQQQSQPILQSQSSAAQLPPAQAILSQQQLQMQGQPQSIPQVQKSQNAIPSSSKVQLQQNMINVGSNPSNHRYSSPFRSYSSNNGSVANPAASNNPTGVGAPMQQQPQTLNQMMPGGMSSQAQQGYQPKSYDIQSINKNQIILPSQPEYVSINKNQIIQQQLQQPQLKDSSSSQQKIMSNQIIQENLKFVQDRYKL